METQDDETGTGRKMRLIGLSLRLILLGCLFVAAYVVALAGSFGDASGSSLNVYLCDTATSMTECQGLEDMTTCAGVDGGVACVKSACGYKLSEGLDISVSGADDPLDEEGTPTDVTSGWMIFWSVVPYALIFGLVAAFLFAGDTTTLSLIFLLAFIAIINEGILKHAISQYRPDGSCLYFQSYGMPSGHAATSIGTLVYTLLESWIGRPDWPLLTKKVLLSVSAFFFLLPVPFSRVYLNDHYRAQVGVGSAVGICLASPWFAFMFLVARTRLDGWIDHRCCNCFGLRNTYRNDEPWLPPWAPCRREDQQSEDDADKQADQALVEDIETGSGEVELQPQS